MQLSFFLGVEQSNDDVSMMQSPGIYWVNVTSQDDAVQLCKQTISAQVKDAHIALISVNNDPEIFIDKGLNNELGQLVLFFLPESRSAILQLPEDLMRTQRPANNLLILNSSIGLWHKLTTREISQWLSVMSSWLHKQNNTLLIVNSGLGADTLYSHLIAEYRLLSGLSSYQHSSDNQHYFIDFWCNNRGVIAKVSLELINDQAGIRINNLPDNLAQRSHEQDLYLVVKSVVEKDSIAPINWTLVNNNEALFSAGQGIRQGTLVFVLEHRNQLDTLIHHLYQLRQQGGNHLKLVVRSVMSRLRESDIHILLACGANLVVPYSVLFEQLVVQIATIRHDVFSRHIPADINVLIKQTQPIPLRGYVSNQLFFQSIMDMISNSLLPQDNKGILLSLQPAKGLNTRRILTLSQMRRDGDLITICADRLLLFLSGCNINELATSLRFIFRLPAEKIFRDRVVWYKDQHILEQLEKCQIEQPYDELSNEELQQLLMPKPQVNGEHNKKTIYHPTTEPKNISLFLE